tara:strand:- start:2386 stop:3492 length:1107 start_codon:yes stop_codon:yes gene_type:complete
MSNNGVFKTLDPKKVVNAVQVLSEQIPITGTIIKGTYGTFPNEENIKYFTSTNDHIDVYDYPHASSSANFMFSMTAGYASAVTIQPNLQKTLKNNIYRQFSQQYVGYDTNQDPVEFNVSGVLNPENTFPPKYDSAIFIDFSRTLMKDEIKKGSFKITLGTGSFANPFTDTGAITTKIFSDAHVIEGNEATYKSNSPMGEYALLQEGTGSTVPENSPYGFLYYQAGLLVLAPTTQVFGTELTSGSANGFTVDEAQSPSAALLTGSINDISNGVRAHVQNIEFNNTTELNSTSYFVNAGPNEFNYSNNPSFVSGSEIIVKNGKSSNPSVAYITTVGLYSADNQLLAVGKLSEPLKKTPSNEIALKMRIDY